MGKRELGPSTRVTRRLYFDDPYQVEFGSPVIEVIEHDGKPAVILEQTCFYPESGGQPSDRGTIDGIQVDYVLEDGDQIIHILEKTFSAEKVHGVIDWQRRFDHMQQHTGQHILSQSFFELLEGETRSFHLGESSSTLEIGIREVSLEDLERVEGRANEIIFQNREVKTYFVPEEEIETIPLRRPPKKAGLLRVVEVSGFDYSACGGTHCRRTGEVGLIKIIKWDKIRNNIRFEFLCGERAFRDYFRKNRSLVEMSSKLSIQESDIGAAVDKLVQEIKDSRKKMRRLQEKVAVFEAQESIGRASGPVIRAVFSEKTLQEARLLALNIIKAAEVAVLYGIRGEEKDHLILASSEKLPLDMRDLIPVTFSLVEGKGGGSSSLVEIVLEKKENLETLLEVLADFIQKKLPS